jgi:hypothetical protein
LKRRQQPLFKPLLAERPPWRDWRLQPQTGFDRIASFNGIGVGSRPVAGDRRIAKRMAAKAAKAGSGDFTPA